MNKLIVKIATTVLVTTILTTSCNNPEKQVEKAQEKITDAAADLDKANLEYIAEVARYRLSTQEKIDNNSKNITALKAKIANEKKEAKAEYIKKLTELELKNSNVKKRMDEYKEEDGRDKWESFKREFNHDMNELEQSFKDLTINNTK